MGELSFSTSVAFFPLAVVLGSIRPGHHSHSVSEASSHLASVDCPRGALVVVLDHLEGAIGVVALVLNGLVKLLLSEIYAVCLLETAQLSPEPPPRQESSDHGLQTDEELNILVVACAASSHHLL
jgi:hypothetical protein